MEQLCERFAKNSADAAIRKIYELHEIKVRSGMRIMLWLPIEQLL